MHQQLIKRPQYIVFEVNCHPFKDFIAPDLLKFPLSMIMIHPDYPAETYLQ